MTPFHVSLMWCDNLGTWPPTVRATYPWMGGAHFFLDQRLFASNERTNSARAEIYFGQWASLTNWCSSPKSTWPHLDPPGRDCQSWFHYSQVATSTLLYLASALRGRRSSFWEVRCCGRGECVGLTYVLRLWLYGIKTPWNILFWGWWSGFDVGMNMM